MTTSRPEFVTLLSNPPVFKKASNDPQIVFDKRLDHPKQKALGQIASSYPLYCVQGPPGVGKTFLVTELISKYLEEFNQFKFLVTAQGHAPLNNLVSTLEEHFKSNGSKHIPFIVNTSTEEELGASEAISIKGGAKKLLVRVCESPLFNSCPLPIKEEILKTSNAINSVHWTKRLPDTGLRDLIIRSANILCATTNTRLLSGLIDRRISFDWTVIEEAGRANGLELLTPMLLSNRWLLIGDPRQLPSFTESQVKHLFENEDAMAELIEQFQKTEHTSLNRNFNSVFDEWLNSNNRDSLAEQAEIVLNLFKFILSKGLEGNKTSSILSTQYRMHPTLAHWVSNLFYPDSPLKTSDKTKRARKSGLRPFMFKNGTNRWLPTAPFVFVSLPFSQRSKLATNEINDNKGIYNPSEISSVVEILAQLEIPRDKKTSIAILAPYNRQIEELKKRVRIEKNGKLKMLWRRIRKLDNCIHTIDSFQGSEADIVVASLVRNNHAPGGNFTQMGIVKDVRRINVLMSRARWKLVIVSSLDYLKARFTDNQDLSQHSCIFHPKSAPVPTKIRNGSI